MEDFKNPKELQVNPDILVNIKPVNRNSLNDVVSDLAQFCKNATGYVIIKESSNRISVPKGEIYVKDNNICFVWANESLKIPLNQTYVKNIECPKNNKIIINFNEGNTEIFEITKEITKIEIVKGKKTTD